LSPPESWSVPDDSTSGQAAIGIDDESEA
jgi:hypothetical protein